MKKLFFIFILTGTYLNSLAQDTIVSITYRNYFSPELNSKNPPFSLFGNFETKNFSIAINAGLSYDKFDLYMGLEYLNRNIIVLDHFSTSNPDQGPNGSFSNQSSNRSISYNGIINNMTIKAGTGLKLKMFKKKLIIKPTLSIGYSFRLAKQETIDAFYYRESWYYYNSADSTTGGSTTEYHGKATDNSLVIKKNNFFIDTGIGIGNNGKRIRYELKFGTRPYLDYIYKYKGSYGTLPKYFKDKYWEFSLGYVF